jgi:hypothetical protein
MCPSAPRCHTHILTYATHIAAHTFAVLHMTHGTYIPLSISYTLSLHALCPVPYPLYLVPYALYPIPHTPFTLNESHSYYLVAHAAMREAIHKRFMPSPHDVREVHARLAGVSFALPSYLPSPPISFSPFSLSHAPASYPYPLPPSLPSFPPSLPRFLPLVRPRVERGQQSRERDLQAQRNRVQTHRRDHRKRGGGHREAAPPKSARCGGRALSLAHVRAVGQCGRIVLGYGRLSDAGGGG